MLVQVLPGEHVLVEDVQKRPDTAVHPILPHMQGAALAVVPVVSSHSGAERQMHLYWEWESHLFTEVDHELKHK